MSFKTFREPSIALSFIGTPSITTRGSEFNTKDPVPRTRIFCFSPGAPPPEVICTPATFPCSNSPAERLCPLPKSLEVTKFTEPVTSFFFATP